ncbi:4Fe-4S dicluster domain-containing protein [bacterium]|nr:4Fe-4S dicluster domain-containing protein [candidate division CSSED10-310 bacterium]
METAQAQRLIDEVKRLTSQDPLLCYQCGKCSAGCPIREFMDYSPNQIIRFVQLGMVEKALRSKTIWLCAGCLTCSTRCPQEFDLAKLMDALREVALAHGIKPSDSDVYKFHKAFLKQIEQNGRAFEFGLIRDYKLSTFHLFQDVDIAPSMFLKGKISLRPHRIKNLAAIRGLFERVRKQKR